MTRRTKIGHHLGFWLATLAVTFAHSPVQAAPYIPFQLTGRAIQNRDGDTFRLQTKERGVLVVRFSGSSTDILVCSDDGYETVRVQDRKLATFGVDIAKLEEWIEEDLTEQRRLPGVG